MGDYYRRDGNNRRPKRRYREDDEDGDYRRNRYDRGEDPLQKLRRVTIGLADSALVKIEDAIQGVASDFVIIFDTEEYKTGYLDCLHDLVLEQPFKIPFVATVVRVANVEKEEVGKAVVEHFAAALQKFLVAGAFTQVKLVLRFFACLGDMIGSTGVLPVLEQLIAKLSDYRKQEDEGLLLALAYIVLITVPYAEVSGAPQFTAQTVSDLLEKITPFKNVRHPMQTLLDPFSGNVTPYNDEKTRGQHMVEVLFLNIQGRTVEKTEGNFSGQWALPTPWEAMKTVGTMHEMPALEFPEEYAIDKAAVYPEMYFSVFADQPVETVPSPSELSSTLFRDAIVDTINILDCNRNAVSRFLIEVDCFFNPKSFIKRATAYDRVAEVADGVETSRWKPEDVAVDAIFSQLFRLPTPSHKLVYYHSILTELCKLAPAAIAPSLGRAIRFMYRNLETLDTELIYRFVDWFSHHLSNFGYTWKWGEWTEHLSYPDVHPKKAFILGSLEKEIRLSFATRIKGTLPDAFKELIPEEREKEQPVFKFDLPENPLAEQGKNLLTVVSERKEDAEIDAVLETITTAAQAASLTTESDPLAITRDAYVTCICHIGAKSLSHVLSCIERCKEKLLAIGAQHPDARRQIVGSVLAYWKDQPGIGANVVDKLLNYSIVTPLSVVEWVLHDAGPEALSNTHAWEMVATTINKVNNRVGQILAAKASVLGAEGVTEEQIAVFLETLKGAEAEQALLLAEVTRALSATAENDESEVDAERRKWVQWWARGWLRAFKRKFGVKDEDAKMIDAAPVEEKEEAKEVVEAAEVSEGVVDDDAAMYGGEDTAHSAAS